MGVPERRYLTLETESRHHDRGEDLKSLGGEEEDHELIFLKSRNSSFDYGGEKDCSGVSEILVQETPPVSKPVRKVGAPKRILNMSMHGSLVGSYLIQKTNEDLVEDGESPFQQVVTPTLQSEDQMRKKSRNSIAF